ncbi:MAG: T9SS type A sorting domain-containing protein [Ignavibacteriales bacterium]|nr:T9SS type A sorting domain-containing protein [Ignavibacteriales bacterium]
MLLIKKVIWIFGFLSFHFSIQLYSQDIQRYRDDAKGDLQYRRQGIMDGNLVRTLFDNCGMIGQWPNQPSGEWPKASGHSYLDGLCVLIASEVKAPGNEQIIHPLETYYREWVDKDPVTGALWTLTPVPGYANPNSQTPAISADPNSWPSEWPAALGLGSDWNGSWYGYFGKNILNADLETFYVMDDSKDYEWTRQPYNFFPIASDLARGGLGLRVEVRGFQWSNPLTADVIFWQYDVTNISDNDYDNTCFGIFTDPGVGGIYDSGDDCGSFDTELDLVYAFDSNGFGVPNNWKTGLIGYAYLESPGNPWDGFDNDVDGMIDERQDDGIDNDNDWKVITDDVGTDGLPNTYDFGEGDGMPSNGEPNFDKTDKHESDQIGLTAVSIYRLGDGGVGGGWPKDDETMWLKMQAGTFDTSLQNSNISIVFSSGTFPFKQGSREKYSMALLFGENFDDLALNKNNAQSIYDRNYNFTPDSTTNVNEESSNNCNKYSILQNYPNPFNPTTTINYNLQSDGIVTVKIFDMLGREVKTLVNDYKNAGSYSVVWDGKDNYTNEVCSGIYFYDIKFGDNVITKKMILIR